MDNLHSDLTNSIPIIELNIHTGFFKFSGKSIPENAIKVYQPIMNTVIDYCKSPVENTTVILDFEYVNTSSSKWLFYILEKFETLYIKKHKISISFFYEDESMLLTGRYLTNNLAIPIDLIKK